jgi:hypothetical protein
MITKDKKLSWLLQTKIGGKIHLCGGMGPKNVLTFCGFQLNTEKNGRIIQRKDEKHITCITCKNKLTRYRTRK